MEIMERPLSLSRLVLGRSEGALRQQCPTDCHLDCNEFFDEGLGGCGHGNATERVAANLTLPPQQLEMGRKPDKTNGKKMPETGTRKYGMQRSQRRGATAVGNQQHPS